MTRHPVAGSARKGARSLTPQVLQLLAAVVALACVGLAAWGWHTGRRLENQLSVSARAQAELLAREFSEEARASTEQGLVNVFYASSRTEHDFNRGTLDVLRRSLDSLRQCGCGVYLEDRHGLFAWASTRPDSLFEVGMDAAQVPGILRRIQEIAGSMFPGQNLPLIVRVDGDGREVVAPVFAQSWEQGIRVIGYLSDHESLVEHHFRPMASMVDSLRFGLAARDVVAWRVVAPGGDTILSRGRAVAGDPVVNAAFLRPRFRLDADSVASLRPDPRSSPYRVLVQVHPRALGAWLYGPIPTGPLPVGVLLIGALGLGAALLLVARRLLQQMAEREAFVTAIAHDLRTPLTQILLYGESMQLDRPAVRTREQAARVIVRETRRLIHMVENALAFARTGTARPTLRLESVELGTHLGDLLATMQPAFEAAGVSVSSEVPSGLTVRADPSALTQVLTNLLDNALRFGPRGQEVRVTAAANGTRAIVHVIDQGPGIPATLRERVFEPFVSSGAAGGTGIGLATSRQLAELMDGSLEVAAGNEAGAQLELRLPLAGEDGGT
jgi:signal transduction histidine kinase